MVPDLVPDVAPARTHEHRGAGALPGREGVSWARCNYLGKY